jgi:hypothetical protein
MVAAAAPRREQVAEDCPAGGQLATRAAYLAMVRSRAVTSVGIDKKGLWLLFSW